MSRWLPLLGLLSVAVMLPAGHAADPLVLPVWSGPAPGAPANPPAETAQQRGKDGVMDRALRQVHTPTITVYLPDRGVATGAALLIAPGGGYEHVTIDKEGNDIARRFVSDGIACIVLKYRLPATPGAGYTPATPMGDAVQALKVIRAHAAEWGLDPARVGMLGFSSGGNLTALTGTRPAKEDRPSFLALMYPVIGKDFGPAPADVPQTFIAQANDTPIGPDNSLRFYEAVSAQKVPVELHLFAEGGHGFGLGKSGTPAAEWVDLLERWMSARGFLPAKGVVVASPSKADL